MRTTVSGQGSSQTVVRQSVAQQTVLTERHSPIVSI